jgi:hypothetical protein
MSPTGSTSSLSPVSLLQQNRPTTVTPLVSRPASPKHEDQPNPLETHELHCHQARGGMYAAQLKRARSQTPSIRSSSRLDCTSLFYFVLAYANISVPVLSRQVSPAAPSPIASTSSGARYLNRDPAVRLTCINPAPITAVSTEQVEGAHPLERCDSATDLLTLATEGSHGLMKPKSEWQVRLLLLVDNAVADPPRKTVKVHSAPSPTVPLSSPPTLDSTSCPPADITVECAD